MSGNGRRDERERPDANDNNIGGYLAVGALATLVGGGIYWLTKGKKDDASEQPEQQKKVAAPPPQRKPSPPAQREEAQSASSGSYFDSLMNAMETFNTFSEAMRAGGQHAAAAAPAPEHPRITNLNSLLDDIFVRYVQIKDPDFQLHYSVFDTIFRHLHQKMNDVDPYYRKYSSTVQFAGSHFDNLRIRKPDEFDMDIVISLPLNLEANPINAVESDIYLEPRGAGFVQLRMGVQFQNLPMRDGNEWQNNKAAFGWMDESNYLMRSKFIDWFKSVVNRALNCFQVSGNLPVYYVNGVPYSIKKSSSGPAMTLIIENVARGFKLDVDLVPALKFPESRWPIGKSYRPIPAGCARGCWLVVGKPPRAAPAHDAARSWRLALHNQERGLMYNSGNLRQAARLLKKLRDSLEMKEVSSYYVKTLFFWEIVERDDKSFWQRNSPAFLFKLMVGRLHAALVNRKIPYFWNKNNNLIEGVHADTLSRYAAKLVPLMQILENPTEYKQVAKYLLTPQEFKDYNARFLHI